MSAEALLWLAEYAAHTRAAADRFADVGLSPEHLAACQEFDRRLRAFDGDDLRSAASSPEGARLVGEITAARAALTAAAAEARAALQEEQDGLRKGAQALRGYGEAGQRGGPDARFLTRRG